MSCVCECYRGDVLQRGSVTGGICYRGDLLQRGCVTECYRGDGCDLASTLCKYDLRKGDLFVLSWASVRRGRLGSISSALIMCGGGVRSILILPLLARCLETIDVCIWRMFVFMSVVVIVWGLWEWLLCSGRC